MCIFETAEIGLYLIIGLVHAACKNSNWVYLRDVYFPGFVLRFLERMNKKTDSHTNIKLQYIYDLGNVHTSII